MMYDMIYDMRSQRKEDQGKERASKKQKSASKNKVSGGGVREGGDGGVGEGELEREVVGIRECVVASAGYVLVSLDYCQVCVRESACWCA